MAVLQEELTPNEAYEHSEMLLYRAMILNEGGKHNEALTHLDLCQVRPLVPSVEMMTLLAEMMAQCSAVHVLYCAWLYHHMHTSRTALMIVHCMPRLKGCHVMSATS